jgi:hypothetical protein
MQKKLGTYKEGIFITDYHQDGLIVSWIPIPMLDGQEFCDRFDKLPDGYNLTKNYPPSKSTFKKEWLTERNSSDNDYKWELIKQ